MLHDKSKVFGIGIERHAVFSDEFCMNYVAEKDITPLMDNGHYHSIEVVNDKISSMFLFKDKIALYIYCGVRWDSDHVIILDDETKEIAKEIVRADAFDKVFIATDYFDASINSISTCVTGVRSVQKALLYALIEPTGTMKEMQSNNDFTSLMVMHKKLKTMPFGEVWEEFLKQKNIPADYLSEVKKYENKVLKKSMKDILTAPFVKKM